MDLKMIDKQMDICGLWIDGYIDRQMTRGIIEQMDRQMNRLIDK